RRLLWPPWPSQMVADPALHGVKGWPDRRRLYAHGLGAVVLCLLHPAAAGIGVGLCCDHGVRIRLHASPPGRIFRLSDVDAGSRRAIESPLRFARACSLSTMETFGCAVL